MAQVNVQVNERQLAEVQRDLRRFPREEPRVLSRAINKTAGRAKTSIVRELRTATGIPIGQLNRCITLRRARHNNLSAEIRVRPKPTPLVKLKARQTRKGVTAAVAGGRRLYEHAFVATMPSGHTGVFRRFGPKVAMLKGRYAETNTLRQQIRELFAPSIVSVFDKVPALSRRALDSRIASDLTREIITQTKLVLAKRRSA